MLRYFFSFIILLHGLIHLIGFAKAFNCGDITQFTNQISKPAGLLWLITATLFIAAFILFLVNKESWPVVALVAVLLSQILIVTVWQNAKYGTTANVLILVIAVVSWGSIDFERSFRNDVNAHFVKSNEQNDLLTEADVRLLPLPVQKYLRYTGVMGKPKLTTMRIVFEGRMRDKGKDWFPFRSVQYNFFDDPARLFFMKAKMFGLTVPGYHRYQAQTASMDVRFFGLFPIVKKAGAEMNQTETVTLFNDMCLMAPASLIDKRIQWQQLDTHSAKAIFTNGSNTIGATLYFNDTGELVNFISDDRTAVSDMKKYRFSTPVKDYQSINGRRIPKYGEAVWHYPDGEFVYGEFYLKEIDYNVQLFQHDGQAHRDNLSQHPNLLALQSPNEYVSSPN